MLKNTDKYEDTAHFSYRDYRKKPQKTPNRDLMVFVSVFLAGVLIILGFAKLLSPNVDVGITVNDEVSSIAEDEEQVSAIDERLRNLKLEDEGKKPGEEEMFSPELDERVVIPQQKRRTVGQIEAEKNAEIENRLTEQHLNETASAVANHETEKPAEKVQKPVETVNAKVVVGYYATERQAEVAKSIIQDAGLGVVPVVRNMNGYYTLQVGSYSSRERAQQVTNNLLKSNFPARVLVE